MLFIVQQTRLLKKTSKVWGSSETLISSEETGFSHLKSIEGKKPGLMKKQATQGNTLYCNHKATELELSGENTSVVLICLVT